MQAIVFQHEAHEGPGLVGEALEGAGFALLPRFREVQGLDRHADLVVVLGGPMDSWDDARHPFLAAEVDLLRARLAYDRPCLGICLGAQLLARAAGAQAFRGRGGLEVGARTVTWTDEGLADAVTGDGGRDLVVAEWHRDTFVHPPHAVHLARSPSYEQQAFRIGRSFGLQFHLELDAATFTRWLQVGEAELAANGVDLDVALDLRAFAADAPRRQALAQRLAAHFANAVAG